MSKMPLTMIYKEHNGEYTNVLDIPKRKKLKNKKRKRQIERDLYEAIQWRYKVINNSYKNIQRNANNYKSKPIPKQKKIMIKSYKDLIELNKNNKIVIISFIYNLGKTNEIKNLQNYCEIKYRVNREDDIVLYKTVLHKEEVVEVLDYLSNRK